MVTIITLEGASKDEIKELQDRLDKISNTTAIVIKHNFQITTID